MVDWIMMFSPTQIAVPFSIITGAVKPTYYKGDVIKLWYRESITDRYVLIQDKLGKMSSNPNSYYTVLQDMMEDVDHYVSYHPVKPGSSPVLQSPTKVTTLYSKDYRSDTQTRINAYNQYMNRSAGSIRIDTTPRPTFKFA